MRVAVLGTGIMGAGMARSLLRAGHDVRVWNRDHTRAEPLAADGATVAGSAEEAVGGADAVVTMLFDGDATAAVMDVALPALADGAVWVQTGTVGLPDVSRLGGMAAARGTPSVDAPVLGTRGPAEDGALVVLAAGLPEHRRAVTPVFDAIGSRTVVVGDVPGAGTRLKLAVNAWVQTITAGTAQSVAACRGLGVDPQLFLDAIAGTATDSPYAHVKGGAMIAGEYPPAFRLDGAVKDSGLIAAALADAGVDTALIAAVGALFRRADDAGHGGEDMAAVVHSFER